MKKAILCIFLFLFIFPLTGLAADSKGNITVKITQCRDDKGEALVTLFKSEDGFPVEPEKAYRKITGKITDGKSEIIVSDVPYGEYAIAVLHDENRNGKMDRSIFGAPQEGNGASNNPVSGPPKYDEAKFILNSENLNIDIKMKN